MQVERLDIEQVKRLGGPTGAAAYLRGLVPGGASVESQVREIVAGVRERGDAAVADYTRRFDTGGAEPRALLVPTEDLDEAIKVLSLELVAALQVEIANVAQVAHAGVGEDVSVGLPQGQRVNLREVPVGSTAVYVPGGRAPYPSTLVMGVVTARAAGVLDVAVCAPPAPDGRIDPEILGTCRLLGVGRVYSMGGAQAIAALAYGTKTVRAVDMIVGPGNLYVQEAKRQLSGTVGIDGFAGPSDVLIVFGEDTDPTLVALDLLAQAEHGPGSLVGAICSSEVALTGVAEEIERLTALHYDPGSAVCVLLQTADVWEAVELANAFAPEHLQLMGSEAEELATAVRTAGCLFVGATSATAFGDYVAGSNHILPTGGAARFASSLSARTFRRRMSEVRIGEGAVRKLAVAGATIAHAEGFPFHAQSMEARIEENAQP